MYRPEPLLWLSSLDDNHCHRSSLCIRLCGEPTSVIIYCLNCTCVSSRLPLLSPYLLSFLGVRTRSVHHMGIPAFQHRLNSWEWEREWEWWTGNGREMGIVVWKKFSCVSWLARWTICYLFIAVLRDLTVLWLTRELACLYFVVDVLSLDLHCIFVFY